MVLSMLLLDWFMYRYSVSLLSYVGVVLLPVLVLVWFVIYCISSTSTTSSIQYISTSYR
jgi:hypothetical protein